MIYNMEQGTEEWLDVKRGKFSASNFSKLFMNESTQGYNDIINQIVFERITGKSPEFYVNEYMLRGTELEPEARADYEFTTGNKVEQVGFIELNEWVGVSPDGLIGEDGMLEVKCPKFSTLINQKLSKKVPKDYYWQMQGQMYVADRMWVDYYVYHPDLDPLLLRVERNDKDIEELRQKLDRAIELATERINKLKEK